MEYGTIKIKTKIIFLGIIFFGLFGVAEKSLAATYYVDYDNGNDNNNGTSTSTPWKHAPGDLNATGNPGIKAYADNPLQPGDTVLLKGGVIYRGSISIDGRWINGTQGNPITYKGDGWGTEKAILDGTEKLTGTWHQCASAADCGGNANWQNIYYQDLAASFTISDFQQGFYEDGKFLSYSQEPNPPDPFFYDRTDALKTVSYSQVTRTSVNDPDYFIQSDPDYWNGAYVIVWHNPNVTSAKKINSYDPNTHTVYYDDLGNDTYPAGYDEYYAVLNSLHILDKPGEYYLDETAHRFYVWPADSDNPSGHIFSVRKEGTGLFASCNHDLNIEGLEIRGYEMGIRAIDSGSGITPDRVNIRSNYIHDLKSNDWYALQVGGNNMLVDNNKIINCQRAVGILGGGNNVTVSNNLVQRATRVGIWFMGALNSSIKKNIIKECKGAHANGMSVYEGSDHVVVDSNHISDSNIAFTFERGGSLDVFNNIFLSKNDSVVSNWGGMTGTINFYNNIALQSPNNCSVNLGPDSETATFNVHNNIMGGGGRDGGSNNIYTGLCWNQDIRYGWKLGTGEILETDLNRIFVDPANGDYHLKAGSPAIDSGVSTALFNHDFSGIIRPLGTTWDIGPYEYQSGSSDTTPPAAPSGLVVQ